MKNTKTPSVSTSWYSIRLREVCEAMVISTEQLAQRTGLTVAYLEKLEAAAIQPSFAEALMIANAMRLSILDFIPDTAPEQCRAVITRRRLRW